MLRRQHFKAGRGVAIFVRTAVTKYFGKRDPRYYGSWGPYQYSQYHVAG